MSEVQLVAVRIFADKDKAATLIVTERVDGALRRRRVLKAKGVKIKGLGLIPPASGES